MIRLFTPLIQWESVELSDTEFIALARAHALESGYQNNIDDVDHARHYADVYMDPANFAHLIKNIRIRDIYLTRELKGESVPADIDHYIYMEIER